MTFTELQWVDWAIAAIVLVSTLISFKRGLFREALSLVIWTLAVIISIVFHEQLSAVLSPYIESVSLRKVADISSLFVICLIVGGLVSLLVSQLIKITGLSGIDRLLGMIFGLLRGIVVVIVIILIARNLFPLQEEVWWDKSVLLPHILRLEAWTVTAAAEIRDLIMPLMAK